MKTVRSVAIGGLIAALYAALTILLAPISYGPLQVRVSEALTVLPFLTPVAIPGLYIGALLANIFGGFGPWDIFGGSFLTLIAAYLTYLTRRTGKLWLAPIPPVLVNALGVSAYLQFLVEGFQPGLRTYFYFVGTIGLGEVIACFGLGYPLLRLLVKSGWVERLAVPPKIKKRTRTK